ncbi:MAG: methylated-DNA--[protein]-cysteine S-methyltransferase [Betaproteobacteria bacterium]|jgi:methylated-DNA-[protein]-cysteine S-methyltransferase|nr:methylated-DNA--[protein]-cysteine S-methyltransferase [Betaproteobacteria bacterium]
MKFDHVHIAKRIQSPLGPVVIAASKAGLCGLWFDGQKHQPRLMLEAFNLNSELLDEVEAQLAAWFAGKLKCFEIELDLSLGTDFQQSVWQGLRGIPYGKTVSYGELSAKVDRPKASRAVGAAVGRNPISLIVPCHRVVGAHGALTGYAGGLERKLALLRLEATL